MYDKLCKNADETKTLVFRKQSKCQGQPGIVSFRTDVIEDPGE